MFLHGSGFHISLDPDPDPIFEFLWNKKKCRKVSKSDLSEENLKFMTKDRPDPVCPQRLDPVNIRLDPQP